MPNIVQTLIQEQRKTNSNRVNNNTRLNPKFYGRMTDKFKIKKLQGELLSQGYTKDKNNTYVKKGTYELRTNQGQKNIPYNQEIITTDGKGNIIKEEKYGVAYKNDGSEHVKLMEQTSYENGDIKTKNTYSRRGEDYTITTDKYDYENSKVISKKKDYDSRKDQLLIEEINKNKNEGLNFSEALKKAKKEVEEQLRPRKKSKKITITTPDGKTWASENKEWLNKKWDEYFENETPKQRNTRYIDYIEKYGLKDAERLIELENPTLMIQRNEMTEEGRRENVNHGYVNAVSIPSIGYTHLLTTKEKENYVKTGKIKLSKETEEKLSLPKTNYQTWLDSWKPRSKEIIQMGTKKEVKEEEPYTIYKSIARLTANPKEFFVSKEFEGARKELENGFRGQVNKLKDVAENIAMTVEVGQIYHRAEEQIMRELQVKAYKKIGVEPPPNPRTNLEAYKKWEEKYSNRHMELVQLDMKLEKQVQKKLMEEKKQLYEELKDDYFREQIRNAKNKDFKKWLSDLRSLSYEEINRRADKGALQLSFIAVSPVLIQGMLSTTGMTPIIKTFFKWEAIKRGFGTLGSLTRINPLYNYFNKQNIAITERLLKGGTTVGQTLRQGKRFLIGQGLAFSDNAGEWVSGQYQYAKTLGGLINRFMPNLKHLSTTRKAMIGEVVENTVDVGQDIVESVPYMTKETWIPITGGLIIANYVFDAPLKLTNTALGAFAKTNPYRAPALTALDPDINPTWKKIIKDQYNKVATVEMTNPLTRQQYANIVRDFEIVVQMLNTNKLTDEKIKFNYDSLMQDIPKDFKEAISLDIANKLLLTTGSGSYKSLNFQRAVDRLGRTGVLTNEQIKSMNLKRAGDYDGLIDDRRINVLTSKEKYKVSDFLDENGNIKSEQLQARINMTDMKFEDLFNTKKIFGIMRKINNKGLDFTWDDLSPKHKAMFEALAVVNPQVLLNEKILIKGSLVQRAFVEAMYSEGIISKERYDRYKDIRPIVKEDGTISDLDTEILNNPFMPSETKDKLLDTTHEYLKKIDDKVIKNEKVIVITKNNLLQVYEIDPETGDWKEGLKTVSKVPVAFVAKISPTTSKNFFLSRIKDLNDQIFDIGTRTKTGVYQDPIGWMKEKINNIYFVETKKIKSPIKIRKETTNYSPKQYADKLLETGRLKNIYVTSLKDGTGGQMYFDKYFDFFLNKRTIDINNELSPKRFEEVLAHELEHATQSRRMFLINDLKEDFKNAHSWLILQKNLLKRRLNDLKKKKELKELAFNEKDVKKLTKIQESIFENQKKMELLKHDERVFDNYYNKKIEVMARKAGKEKVTKGFDHTETKIELKPIKSPFKIIKMPKYLKANYNGLDIGYSQSMIKTIHDIFDMKTSSQGGRGSAPRRQFKMDAFLESLIEAGVTRNKVLRVKERLMKGVVDYASQRNLDINKMSKENKFYVTSDSPKKAEIWYEGENGDVKAGEFMAEDVYKIFSELDADKTAQQMRRTTTWEEALKNDVRALESSNPTDRLKADLMLMSLINRTANVGKMSPSELKSFNTGILLLRDKLNNGVKPKTRFEKFLVRMGLKPTDTQLAYIDENNLKREMIPTYEEALEKSKLETPNKNIDKLVKKIRNARLNASKNTLKEQISYLNEMKNNVRGRQLNSLINQQIKTLKKTGKIDYKLFEELKLMNDKLSVEGQGMKYGAYRYAKAYKRNYGYQLREKYKQNYQENKPYPEQPYEYTSTYKSYPYTNYPTAKYPYIQYTPYNPTYPYVNYSTIQTENYPYVTQTEYPLRGETPTRTNIKTKNDLKKDYYRIMTKINGRNIDLKLRFENKSNAVLGGMKLTDNTKLNNFEVIKNKDPSGILIRKAIKNVDKNKFKGNNNKFREKRYYQFDHKNEKSSGSGLFSGMNLLYENQ